MGTTTLYYLIDDFRIHLGDYTEPYSYSDTVVLQVLNMACKYLKKKWGNRYTIDSAGLVSRNSLVTFNDAEPPVIEVADEVAFILQASIILKSADIRNSIWDIGSWRDDEISFSNIASSNAYERSLMHDIDALKYFLEHRLFAGSKQSLPGFRAGINYYEG